MMAAAVYLFVVAMCLTSILLRNLLIILVATIQYVTLPMNTKHNVVMADVILSVILPIFSMDMSEILQNSAPGLDMASKKLCAIIPYCNLFLIESVLAESVRVLSGVLSFNKMKRPANVMINPPVTAIISLLSVMNSWKIDIVRSDIAAKSVSAREPPIPVAIPSLRLCFIVLFITSRAIGPNGIAEPNPSKNPFGMAVRSNIISICC